MRKNGVSLKRLSDKQIRFVFAYLMEYNASKAAIEAGYSKNSAQPMGAKLLKNPKIKALIGKLRKQDCEKFTIQRYEILEHLHAGATRNGKSFVNDKGVIHSNLNDLPDEVTRSIDGLKQKTKTYTQQDGTEVTEVETELKLMSKAACLDMAMKHKGLFAAAEVEMKVKFSLDDLYKDNSEIIDVDPTDQYLDAK